jgi:hypothetical protein
MNSEERTMPDVVNPQITDSVTQSSVDTSTEDAALAAPPDDENPAIIDLHKTFVITVISAALFVGAVVIFIL